MKCMVSRRASWFLQGGYFLCRGSLAPSDRHMILSGWGEKELTRDPGPSDFSSQNPGMRMSKTHWNPLVCGRHLLAFAPPRRPSFVESLCLSPWKKACFVHSLAELNLKTFWYLHRRKLLCPSCEGKQPLLDPYCVLDLSAFLFSIKCFLPLFPIPPHQNNSLFWYRHPK